MELFIFPLGQTVLYPGTSKPLNIFEPRYIQMVNDSLRSGTPIGIGFVDEPEQMWTYYYGQKPQFIRPVVGYGQASVIEQRSDGSMMIFLHSHGKAKLGAVIDKQTPYIVCEAENVTELHTISAESIPHYLVIQKVLEAWLKKHVPDPVQREQFSQHMQTPMEVIGCYASFMVSDPDLQQMLLEMDDINEKIMTIHRMASSGDRF